MLTTLLRRAHGTLMDYCGSAAMVHGPTHAAAQTIAAIEEALKDA